jgi:glycosyltransferase involved in cell wall biosynthesis
MKDKKTIWFISQYAGGPGIGMQYRQFLFCKHLNQNGHKASIISSSFSHLYDQLPDSPNGIIEDVYYHWIKTPKYKKSISIGRFWNMIVFAFRLFFMHDSSLGRPDLIIVSSPSMFPIISALKWKRKYNCKVFFEVRDIWPLTLQELGGLSTYHPLVLFMRYFEKLAYKKSDLIVSLLPNAEQHFIASGMKREKFRYLPNGVELENNTDYNFTETTFPFSKDAFVIGYGGSIGKANALHYLIQAAHQLKHEKNIHFVIVGKGDELSRLKQDSQELENVHFLPAMKKSLFLKTIERFDLCYIGLENEALFRFGVSPNKLFDYMKMKKPILYAIDSGNKPVEEAQCGWSVRPGDIEAIQNAIMTASKSEKKILAEMGIRGYQYVLEHHSYSVLCKKLISWLNE